MNIFILLLCAACILGLVLLLIKGIDIKISLLLVGILLIYTALILHKQIAFTGFISTGIAFFDPFKLIALQFKKTLANSGFVILLLGGYAAYMSKIGANAKTVALLTRLLSCLPSSYGLVPVVFILATTLSLVIPSASNLAIILLSTLFPLLLQAGLSPLCAGALIATSATIVPTPLGSDNIAMAKELATTSQYLGMSTSEYVFKYHAIISIPTIFFMSIIHLFWQRYMDKRGQKRNNKNAFSYSNNALKDYLASLRGDINTNEKNTNTQKSSKASNAIYSLLPLLPIIVLILVFVLNSYGFKMSLGVGEVAIFCFFIALICEVLSKGVHECMSNSKVFFTGMGSVIGVVALVVCASVFVCSLKSIGLLDIFEHFMRSFNGPSFFLPLILVAFTSLIVLLSGSGIALIFAFVPLIIPLSQAAGIEAVQLSIPLGLAANLMRAVSPVSAVVLIVSASLKVSPLEVIKRTCVPLIAGLIFMFVLASFVL